MSSADSDEPAVPQTATESIFDVRDLRDAEARVEQELLQRLVDHLVQGRATSEVGQIGVALVSSSKLAPGQSLVHS